jgi:hypothetical protein
MKSMTNADRFRSALEVHDKLSVTHEDFVGYILALDDAGLTTAAESLRDILCDLENWLHNIRFDPQYRKCERYRKP